MKKAAHLTKLDDLGDPNIHQLVRELCEATRWHPNEPGNLSFFTILQEWVVKGGGRRATAKIFAIDGVWNLRIPQIPSGQLQDCLISLVQNKGGSLEPFGNDRILEFIKKLFR